MKLPDWNKQYDWTKEHDFQKQFDWKKAAKVPTFNQIAQGAKGKAQGAWGKFAPKVSPMFTRKKSK